jgi:hypothetical protein
MQIAGIEVTLQADTTKAELINGRPLGRRHHD